MAEQPCSAWKIPWAGHRRLQSMSAVKSGHDQQKALIYLCKLKFTKLQTIYFAMFVSKYIRKKVLMSKKINQLKKSLPWSSLPLLGKMNNTGILPKVYLGYSGQVGMKPMKVRQVPLLGTQGVGGLSKIEKAFT